MKRILIVDDEVDIARTLSAFLEMSGYEVATAGDGVEALQEIVERRPDLVITDLMMPRMDGGTLIARLMSSPTTRDIPVIAISADRNEHAFPFLRKPFSVTQLIALIERALGPTRA